jgi:hypothetical protein
MRAFVVMIALLGLFAIEVRAGEDDLSPVIGKFPDTANNRHVYLFMLTEHKIHIQMAPQEFCKTMDYGDAVIPQGQAIDEPNKDEPNKDDVVKFKGELVWVICRFSGK